MKTIQLSKAFTDDSMLSRIFSWLTRIGAAPAFGSRPIGWYQSHQCHCIDILQESGADTVRCRGGNIQWSADAGDGNGLRKMSISTIELFQQADNRCRKS